MYVPACCPVCSKGPLEEILDDVTLTAEFKSGTMQAGGLKAFKCVEENHIFFLRQADMEQLLKQNLPQP